MPIKIPEHLPAKKVLESENIFVMNEHRATHQDIRPLEIALLNLMPTKIETEIQISRLLGNSPLQVNLTLLTTASYQAKNVAEDHLISFYKTWDEVKHKKFDGLIVTGAPVENLDWEEVTYWKELTDILDWSKKNVYCSFFICWGAQAALKHFYGVEKQMLPKKLFGVYPHHITKPHTKLLRGFDDTFYVPISRHTESIPREIKNVPELEILATTEEGKPYLIQNKKMSQIFAFNHSEYDLDTLRKEYNRDVEKGLPIDVPKNYFPDDNPINQPHLTWRSNATLLFTNWLNYYVYQETPYELNKIG